VDISSKAKWSVATAKNWGGQQTERSRKQNCADTTGTVLAGSLAWPFPMPKYK